MDVTGLSNVAIVQRHEGTLAVRAADAAIVDAYPDAQRGKARHVVGGDRGLPEWTLTGTMKDRRRVDATGCDVFAVRSGTNAIRNSNRKSRPPIG